jgi:antitoxin component HigA of HigAB toxin-antitoxin module
MESPSAFLRKSMSRRGSAQQLDGSSEKNKSPMGIQRRASFSLRSTFNTAKYSAALENVKVDQDEEMDSLEDNRIKLKKYMSTSPFGKTYENAILALSILSTIEFIHQSYMDPAFPGDQNQLKILFKMESVFIGFFLFDWVLNFFMADDKIKYFFS